MVSNDYRELILFLMIYQTPNNIQHSIFNPTLLGKSHSSTHLVSWMIKNWFVCAEKWGEAEVTRDSSCWPPDVPWFTVHNPDHSGGDSGRSPSLKASDPSMGRPGAWPEWDGCDRGQQWAGQGQPVTTECDLALTWSSDLTWSSQPLREWLLPGLADPLGHGYMEDSLDYTMHSVQTEIMSPATTFLLILFSFLLDFDHPWWRGQAGPDITPCGGSWVAALTGLRPPGWAPSLRPRPTQTHNWNKSRTPPQINQFSSLWS